MNGFERAMLSLDAYRNTVNGIGGRYRKESQRNDPFRGSQAYTDMQGNTNDLFSKEFREAQAREQKEIDGIFDDINKSVSKWINVPVRDGKLLDTVMTAREMGIKFTLPELQSLNQSFTGYWGNKIICEIAKESGLNDTQFRQYNDLSTITQSVKNARTSANNFLRWYTGTNCECMDLLNDSDKNNPLVTALCSGAADSPIFKENSSILQAALIFDQDDCPASSYHRVLSDGDKGIINYMFSGCDTVESKKTRAASLIGENPDLQEIFSLDSGLAAILPEK